MRHKIFIKEINGKPTKKLLQKNKRGADTREQRESKVTL